MQRRSSAPADAQTTHSDCEFCQLDSIAMYILKETANFRIVADHAPLIEGHLLIIPRQHYACYGAVPAELDDELLSLKQEVRLFFEQYYAPPVYWEHGVFRQTVFHAHLHCFPFGDIGYVPDPKQHWQRVYSQADIRDWYNKHGYYFYMEDSKQALLFAPNMDDYMYIIRDVLGAGVAARNKRFTPPRSSQQRQLEGKPLIEALTVKWQQFQQQQNGNIEKER
jgi:diadenosine tetraphosphate (Ap4A) HIT family hydrolase